MGFCRFMYILGMALLLSLKTIRSKNNSFYDNYGIIWGSDHAKVFDQGREIHLSMDKKNGSSFESKLKFGSGLFQMWMKLPNKDTAGVVTAFYLTSKGRFHDEVDFEFLGNREKKPIILQTNVFANDRGRREQRIFLWFDPSANFHSYRILWNPYQIVFYVDDVPIRIFKNKRNVGVRYPTNAMRIECSIWDGESWATDGGMTKTNWSNAPFVAIFRGFNIYGCSMGESQQSIRNGNETAYINPCYASKYWWNGMRYRALTPVEHAKLQCVRNKYLTYDYCKDDTRFPKTPFECSYNT